MNLNGQVLKLSFLIIIVSLCVVMVIATIDFMIGKMVIESYKGLLEILGIPTLIGVIVQSFLHSNQDDNSKDKWEVKAP